MLIGVMMPTIDLVAGCAAAPDYNGSAKMTTVPPGSSTTVSRVP